MTRRETIENAEQSEREGKLEDLQPGEPEIEQVKGGRISLVDNPSM
jgi:hypothetical protein